MILQLLLSDPLPTFSNLQIVNQTYYLTATRCGGGSCQAGGQQNRMRPAGIRIRPSAGLRSCQRAGPGGKTVQGKTSGISSTCKTVWYGM